ncbi:MAG: hypothetical protein M1826_000662 [Phylliscum demangeonii]|nr:MAG: hypothetical protein M1826_000662 [Phylliscum demangeonii]
MVAASFVANRVKGVSITPHYCAIQDKDEDYYMQFKLVICGLDSIEARRWINATLVGLVDVDDMDSLKPLIDGGTEGDILDTDDPEHTMWLYHKALHRAKAYDIPGVTYALTQGVIKNIIPAIAATNSVIAASCCNEVFKIASNANPYLTNYMMYSGDDSIYTYTFEHQKKDDCPVCGNLAKTLEVDRSWTLQDLIDQLGERAESWVYSAQRSKSKEPALILSRQVKKPTLRTEKTSLYYQAPPQLEAQTRPNLQKRLVDLVSNGEELAVSDPAFPFTLRFKLSFCR